jgi:isoleucyl-tRNA synthetase
MSSSKPEDYKDTLNLPRTDFPMKANLPTREPEMLKYWDSENIYEKMVARNKGKDTFILHDGPPYANGHIHIGHALNKILKDIIVKYQSMNGRYSPYVPGWDCHGLPIELEVDKKLGKKKAGMPIIEKRKLCREYAEKFVDIQREEFRRLGVFGLWHDPYLTMSYDYEGSIVRELMEFVKSGYAYKGKKPVHWCPSCVTALAEAEVEYADKESPSIFVKFKLRFEDVDRIGLKTKGKTVSLVIWTTTPWTLPANLALAVNPNVKYIALDTNNSIVIVAEALREKVPVDGEPIKVIEGSALVGMSTEHPFVNRHSRVIGGDFVSVEEGTGIVHIAPGHGEDDYEAGLKEGLDIYAPVDQFGKFRGTGIEEIEGTQVFKANPVIVEFLGDLGALIHEETIVHSYPHCWRCKKPVIFRATEQWFISMEHEGLRNKCLQNVDRVRWIPSWGKDRIYGMIKSRPDWCISRQRAWGVPITVLTCKGCKTHITDQKAIDMLISQVEQLSADVWFEKSPEELLPEGFTCPACGSGEFVKESDILDVWFDSGVSHTIALGPRWDLTWPVDMYLEGSDQHRGWFQSSMLAAVGVRGSAPYRTVLTHGFVMDGNGKKMSKSLGNVIAPQDIIKSTGAEILRLWVSAEDYTGDVRISDEIVARLTEAYRKIRNTAKFLLGNIHDFLGGDQSSGMLEIDRWAMSRLQGLTEKITMAYEDFNFHEVYHRLYNFCIVDMSNFYLDILKDRLYTFRADSSERRAAQWVLKEILMTMTRLMAPVLSFTAEEVWKFINDKPAESVFLAGFPRPRGEFRDSALEKKWERLRAIRDDVNKALEIKRRDKFIGNSLEAKLMLYVYEEDFELLNGHFDFLNALFIVSQVEISKDGEGEYKSGTIEGLSVEVLRADGEKCQRCWNRSLSVGTHKDAADICDKCFGNIK